MNTNKFYENIDSERYKAHIDYERRQRSDPHTMMKWIEFRDDNGNCRTFGTDVETGGVFYQRHDKTWNRICSIFMKQRFSSKQSFTSYIEEHYHMTVKGFAPTERNGGWF